MPKMQWASVSIVQQNLPAAVAEAADDLLAALGGAEPDLVIAFASAGYGTQFIMLPSLLRMEFESAQIFGAMGASVIGSGELEEQIAITLMGAVLPDVRLHTVHVEQQVTPPLYAERSLWAGALGIGDTQPDCMLLLAEPFSFSAEPFLKGLDRHFPNAVVLGGLASGMEQPGTPCLILNDRFYKSGCICLTFSGNITVDALVAQGCRPIGEPMFANATHENLILELDGKIPREVLTSLYQNIRRADRKLFTDALFIGVAMDPQRQQYQAGDFLIRTILGLDPDSGALLINTPVPSNSVVQLHLRDAVTSAQDLEQRLKQYRGAHDTDSIGAALLFSCFGRGQAFYGHSDHDSSAFRQHVGDIPLAGVFCNGEIGPVHGTTFVHGYSSVYGIVRSKT